MARRYRRLILKDFFTFTRNFCVKFYRLSGVLAALVFLILCGALAYSLFENLDIGDSVYFAFITAFTIGYGDFVPYSAIGKLVSILVGYVGLVFIGLNVAIATLSLEEIAAEEKDLNKK